MDGIGSLVNRLFPSSGSELVIGGVRVSELAECYGTPFFVYNREIIDAKWMLLRNVLPRRFSIYYSIKANPNQTILKHFLSKGAGLEVASAGEFCQALQAGCVPANVIFAGPGKTPAELELVLARGIGEIHIESVREGERVSAICERQGQRAKVALRINPNGDAEGGAMRMGGRPAVFGIDEEAIDEALDRLLTLKGLEVQGIHLFVGTQILSSDILITQYNKALGIARRIAARLGKPLHTIDFGGGWGIPYFAQERELDLQNLKGGLEVLVSEADQDPLLTDTRFVLEPGRYLVGEAGVYVARVNDIKVSRGKRFLILDGGMHHHLAASGNLGQTIKRNYPIAVLNRLNTPAQEVVDLAGPLCTPLDVLARNAALPPSEIGDLVGVFQSGAYARSASPLNFLSHSTPPEVWVDGAQHCLIRRRGQLEDILRDVIVAESSGAAFH